MKPSVLVADDSEFVRAAIVQAMRHDRELEVIEARNGKEALDILGSRSRVTAIVLDVGMPIIDGTEVLRRIVERGKGSTFVVAIGERGREEALEACRALGADEVLFKPLDVAALGGVLRRWLAEAG